MTNLFWWIRQSALILGAGFFLFYGITLMIAAYHFDNPPDFIMTFFGASLMILISATVLLGLIWRVVLACRKPQQDTS